MASSPPKTIRSSGSSPSPTSTSPAIPRLWLLIGGGDLAGQFYDAGLLDELIIQIGSVTLGQGKPLFPRRVLSPTLRLVSVHQVGPGMAELRYEVQREKTVDAESLVSQ